MGTSFPMNSISQSAFTNNQPLITVEELKQRYLFGVNLTDDNGNEMSDEVIQHNIELAISFVSHELDIIINPTKFVEKYDYKHQDYENFCFLSLKKRPVIAVEAVKAVFSNGQKIIEFPNEWISVEKESGQITITPLEGSYSSMIVMRGGSQLPLIFGVRGYYPHLLEAHYTAGFCHDQIPVIINEIIGLQASLGIFDIVGDLVVGAGIANESVSIDGASASKGSTASAMYSGYSARLESYQKRLKQYLSTARRYYHAGTMSIV